MPNPNALVGRVVRLDPTFEERPRGERSVILGGEERARLDPADPKTDGYARVLDSAAKAGRPVYLEIDPATGLVRRLLLPDFGAVEQVKIADDDSLRVLMAHGHAVHTLRPSHEDFAAFAERLRESARDRRMPLIITFERDGVIVDVRAFRPGPDGDPPPPFPEPRGPVPPLEWLRRFLRWIFEWPLWPWRWPVFLGCVSGARAQEIFDAMAATGCDPSTAPAPCIPFRYPTDGCFARAHEMVRLMIAMGHSPRKVWIKGSLLAPTKNDPDCAVGWGWHVAPTICVRKTWWFWSERMVIDPSLFTTPVSKATWKGAQGDANAILFDTVSDYYFYVYGASYDPGYVQTNADLVNYRTELLLQTVNYGPAPYAFCP